MKNLAFVKRLGVVFSLLLLLGGVTASAVVAQQGSTPPPPPIGQRGGVRGGGSPVQVVVKLDSMPVSGITVTFKRSNGKELEVDTNSDGVATINLPAGHYTISAKNDSGAATKVVTVRTTTTTMTVSLVLVAPTP